MSFIILVHGGKLQPGTKQGTKERLTTCPNNAIQCKWEGSLDNG
jgi:hypothetical protein